MGALKYNTMLAEEVRDVITCHDPGSYSVVGALHYNTTPAGGVRHAIMCPGE